MEQSSYSLEFVAAVLGAVPDPVFVKDEDSRFVFINDALCKFLSQTRENLIGKSDYDFFPKEEQLEI